MHAAPMHKHATRHRACGCFCFCATHPRVQSGRQECQGQAPGSARSTATAALRMSSVLAPGASSARTPAATILFSRSADGHTVTSAILFSGTYAATSS